MAHSATGHGNQKRSAKSEGEVVADFLSRTNFGKWLLRKKDLAVQLDTYPARHRFRVGFLLYQMAHPHHRLSDAACRRLAFRLRAASKALRESMRDPLVFAFIEPGLIDALAWMLAAETTIAALLKSGRLPASPTPSVNATLRQELWRTVRDAKPTITDPAIDGEADTLADLAGLRRASQEAFRKGRTRRRASHAVPLDAPESAYAVAALRDYTPPLSPEGTARAEREFRTRLAKKGARTPTKRAPKSAKRPRRR